jgi:hypothetical protein
MSASPYPLSWPQGFPRWKGARERGAFKTDFDRAVHNVKRSLALFAADSGRKIETPILSSNVNPLAMESITDPGVAVWFRWDGVQVCIPVDRYQSPASNLQAIHHIIEARRVELRHGTLQLVHASFQGFKFLPAPKGEHWRDVLGIAAPNPTRDAIEAAYRDLARKRHPDAGGSAEAMAVLNNARAAALSEVGGTPAP